MLYYRQTSHETQETATLEREKKEKKKVSCLIRVNVWMDGCVNGYNFGWDR
jgi:hypothetical protein